MLFDARNKGEVTKGRRVTKEEVGSYDAFIIPLPFPLPTFSASTVLLPWDPVSTLSFYLPSSPILFIRPRF